MMINFPPADHSGYKPIEYYTFTLKALNSKTKRIEISIQIKFTHPKMGCPNPIL